MLAKMEIDFMPCCKNCVCKGVTCFFKEDLNKPLLKTLASYLPIDSWSYTLAGAGSSLHSPANTMITVSFYQLLSKGNGKDFGPVYMRVNRLDRRLNLVLGKNRQPLEQLLSPVSPGTWMGINF
jgi:hypothetical protein